MAEISLVLKPRILNFCAVSWFDAQGNDPSAQIEGIQPKENLYILHIPVPWAFLVAGYGSQRSKDPL